MMQHIRQGNDIKAFVPDSIQLIYVMGVKDKIKVVQLEHVARKNIRKKLLQRRCAASYFEYRKRRRIGKAFELITVKLAIPKQQVLVRAEPRPITQCCRTIFCLFILQHRRSAPHLTARIKSEPANSDITGTFSRNRPNWLTRLIRRAGVFGWRKSNGSIRISR